MGVLGLADEGPRRDVIEIVGIMFALVRGIEDERHPLDRGSVPDESWNFDPVLHAIVGSPSGGMSSAVLQRPAEAGPTAKAQCVF